MNLANSTPADASISVEAIRKVYGPLAEGIARSPEADLPRGEPEARTGCVLA